jgi:hypothetical protein
LGSFIALDNQIMLRLTFTRLNENGRGSATCAGWVMKTSFELRSQLYTQISAVAQSRAELDLQGWGLL